jgi:hypothetical protein
MDPSQIAEQLVDSGTITEQEKETYFEWGTEYSTGSDAEKATYDKVEKLVDNYDQSRTPPTVPNQPGVDTAQYPDGPPAPPKDTDMPAALNTSGGSGDDVSVSTEALRTFAKNLKLLEDLVNTEHTSVQSVAIKPGTFGAGVYISNAIQKGLRGDTLSFLQSVGSTFTFIRADIETLIADYDSTEERQKITVQQLNNLFNDAFSNVNGYSQYGNSSTDNNGNSNNDGNNGNSNNNGNNGNSNGNNGNNGNDNGNGS